MSVFSDKCKKISRQFKEAELKKKKGREVL